MTENTTSSSDSVINPEALAKRARRPGTRWVRFWSLAQNEMFMLGKVRMFKRNTFVAEEFDNESTETVSMWPWTRVHSLRPVKGGAK